VRYGIIGGGALGLTAALRLAQEGHEVRVLEREHVPGGLASSFEVAPGIWLERYYHHLFRSDRSAVRLIEELGLAERLEWHRPVTTVQVEGVPYQLDSPGSLLRFPPLSLAARLRMAAVLGLLRALPSARPLEGVEADRWMALACGAAGHGVVWRPLLEAKFGSQYRRVSMAWLWARLHDRTSDLGYLRGGFHQLYEALAAAARSAGATIDLGCAVRGIRRVDGGVAVDVAVGGVGQELTFDRVVSTLPPHLTSRLAGLPSPDRSLAGASPLSAQCVILALDRPLTGTYWIGVGDARAPFLAIVEHTAMLSPDDYGGRHLVYLGAYREAGDPRLEMTPSQLVELATPHLRGLNAAFEPSWVQASWAFTAPNAQPVVDRAYRRRIPPFETGLPGLYLATMFQVYPHDRGQNYSIQLAERLVRHLADAGG